MNLLIKWEDQHEWHITESHNHGQTLCQTSIPLESSPLQYAETDIFLNTNGICFKCFHAKCIDVQDLKLWDVYYKHISKDSQNKN